MAVSEELRLVIKTEMAKAIQDFKKLKGETDKTGRGMEKFSAMATAAGTALLGYFGARKLLEVGKSMLQTAADIETATVSFEVLLGSMDRATALMDEIQRFSASTPFQLPELQDAARRLLAFGTAAGDVVSKMEQLGNLAQGNAQVLDRLTNAYGKVQAKGRASLEELNMFTEAGVPIMKELAKQYDVTSEEMFKLIEGGKVGFAEVDEAVRSMATGEGQFAGMLTKQSQTLNGVMSTLRDNVKLLGGTIGELLLPATKKLAGNLTDIVSVMNDLVGAHTRYRELVRKGDLTFDERRQKIEADLIRTQAIIHGLERDRLVMFTTGKRYYEMMIAKAKELAGEIERYNEAEKEAAEAATAAAQIASRRVEIAKLESSIAHIQQSARADELTQTKGYLAMLERITQLNQEILDLSTQTAEAKKDAAREEKFAADLAEAYGRTPQGQIEALEKQIRGWESIIDVQGEQADQVNAVLNMLYDQLEAARDLLGVYLETNQALETASAMWLVTGKTLDLQARERENAIVLQQEMVDGIHAESEALDEVLVKHDKRGRLLITEGMRIAYQNRELANAKVIEDEMALGANDRAEGIATHIALLGQEKKVTGNILTDIEKILKAEKGFEDIGRRAVNAFTASYNRLVQMTREHQAFNEEGEDAIRNAEDLYSAWGSITEEIGEAASLQGSMGGAEFADTMETLADEADRFAYEMDRLGSTITGWRTGSGIRLQRDIEDLGEQWLSGALSLEEFEDAIQDLYARIADETGKAERDDILAMIDYLYDHWKDAAADAAKEVADAARDAAKAMEDAFDEVLDAIGETYDDELYLLRHLLDEGQIGVEEYLRRLQALKDWRAGATTEGREEIYGAPADPGEAGLLPTMPLLSAAPAGGPSYSITINAPTGNAEEIAKATLNGIATLDRRHRL